MQVENPWNRVFIQDPRPEENDGDITSDPSRQSLIKKCDSGKTLSRTRFGLGIFLKKNFVRCTTVCQWQRGRCQPWWTNFFRAKKKKRLIHLFSHQSATFFTSLEAVTAHKSTCVCGGLISIMYNIRL